MFKLVFDVRVLFFCFTFVDLECMLFVYYTAKNAKKPATPSQPSIMLPFLTDDDLAVAATAALLVQRDPWMWFAWEEIWKR